MNKLVALFQAEPALVIASVTGLVDAGLILAVAFGLPVTPERKLAIDGFVSAALALVGLLVAGYAIRSQVTPVAKTP